jgi:hypothetical protein
VSLRAPARFALAFIGAGSTALVLASACGYEGRSLDLFPTAVLDGDLARCARDNECPDKLPFCVEGLCVECVSDAECTDKNPACLAGVCVACTGPQHCPDEGACNASLQRCATACGEGLPACSGPTATCDLTRGFCVECVSDDNCLEPGRPACDLAPGQCVACTSADHCSGAADECDLTRHECIECRVDADCTNGGRCERSGRCEPGMVEMETPPPVVGPCDPAGPCQPECTMGVADAGCMPGPPRP